MKFIFTLLFLAIGFCKSSAQTVVSPSIAAEIKKPTLPEGIELIESEHNFGKIPQGKPVTYSFRVKNITDKPIALDNVIASCGCTTPDWNKNFITPGGYSNIVVGYNAASEGDFNKTITITYNNNQTKIITIRGNVWKTPLTSAPVNEALENLRNQN